MNVKIEKTIYPDLIKVNGKAIELKDGEVVNPDDLELIELARTKDFIKKCEEFKIKSTIS